MNGCTSRRASGVCPAYLAKKFFAVFLSFILVLTLMPAAAWAQVADSDSEGSAPLGGEASLRNGDSQSSSETSADESDAVSSVEGEGISEPESGSIDAVDSNGVVETDDAVTQDATDAVDAAKPSEGVSDEGRAPSSSASVSQDEEEAGSVAQGGAASSEADSATVDESRIDVSVTIIGADSNGKDEIWSGQASYSVEEGSTAANVSEQAFESCGIEADYGESSHGWYLNTIASPFDGRVLGWDEATGKYWQLFVNGVASEQGAGSVALEPGDSVAWYYSSYGASLPGQNQVSVNVVGRDSDGNAQNWGSASVTVFKGDSAREAVCAALDELGLIYETEPDPDDGSWMRILSVSSPEGDGLSLVAGELDEGWNVSGDAWYIARNGESMGMWLEFVDIFPADIEPTELTLFYGEGDNIPSVVEVNPDAPRPDWDSSWPGFGAAGAGSHLAPTDEVEEAWVSQVKESSDWKTNVSEPIVVGDYIYVAAGTTLYVKSKETGETLKSATLVSATNSIARMVYADGLIVVPLDGGRLQALTADELITVWMTPAVDDIGSTGTQQSLSTLTVGDGCLYYGTAAASWSGSSLSGYLMCVSLEDGSILWRNTNETVGYYWSGAAFVDGKVVIGDDSGTLEVLDAATGKRVAALDLGASIRSTVVAGSEEGTLFVVTNNGVLHKVSIDSSGNLSEIGSVKFGSSSTSTPVVLDGKVYITGASLEGKENEWGYMVYGGTLAVIDESSMAIDYRIVNADGNALPADSKSTPLVSEQNGSVYVYFTCNMNPGGIYCYHVGDTEASLIYTPGKSNQNYTMSSVACDGDGTLYYINDSGALFAVKGVAPTGPVDPGDGSGGDSGSGKPGDNGDSGSDDNGGGNSTGDGGVSGDGAHGTPSGNSGAGGLGLQGAGGMQAKSSADGGVASSTKDDAHASGSSDEGESAQPSTTSARTASDDLGDEGSQAQTSERDSSSGAPTWAFVGLGIAVVCLIGAISWLTFTRRASSGEVR